MIRLTFAPLWVWSHWPRVVRVRSMALLFLCLTAIGYADIQATPGQAGLAEWRDAGPGTGCQGQGTRVAESGSLGSGTVLENLHVVRVEVQVQFSNLPATYEIWVGVPTGSQPTLGVDALAHSQVKRMIFDSQYYTCVPGSQTTAFRFHVGIASSQDVTVRYFVKDTGSNTWYTAATPYTVKRFYCHDAGIDTRQTFGDPNEEGRIELNPNAGLANVVFHDWVYRGGLFAGHMPWQNTTDRSGLARIQLYYDPGETQISASTLALFRRGHSSASETPSGDDPDRNTPALGVFLPLANDANLFASGSALEAGSKWSSRLNIAPQGEATSNHRWDYHPISVPTVYLKNEYVNFPLDKFNESGTRIASSQTHATKHIIVALADEADITPEDEVAWRYFASREYDALFTSGIYADSGPRVWTLTEGETSEFQQATVTQ